MLKTTSLLTVISVFELYNNDIRSRGSFLRVLELFGAAAVWYC